MRRGTRLLAACLLVVVCACERPPTEPPPEPEPEPQPEPEPPPEPPVEPPVQPPPEPPVQPPLPVVPDTLYAMTFNIFHDAASDALRIAPWGIRRDMVANAIGASNADVVGLQEAYMWQVDWLVLQLPAYGHFGRGREADGSGESVTVLFKTDRFTVEESGHFWLSPTPEVPGSTGGDAWGGMSVPRIVTWARLGFTANDRELYVYNTHLPSDATGGAEARRLSTILLADRIAARSHPEVPFLLLGDFNGPDEEFPIRYLLREVQACAPSGCNGEEPESPVVVVDTWRLENSGERGTRCRNDASGTGVMHGERVDYVLVMDTMTTDTTGAARSTADGVLSAAIVAPAPSCASDHVPVLARFVVPSY